MLNKLNGTVCFVVSYRAVHYIRNESLIDLLKSNKEINLYLAKNKQKSFLRYLETFIRVIKIRITKNPDYYIIGFRGHEIFFLIYPFIFNKKIIFDEFVSPYDSLINEKKTLDKHSFLAKILFKLEKFILDHSNIVLTDTLSNKNYYSKLFGVNKTKFKVVPLKIDSYFLKMARNIKKHNPYNKEKFNVFFYSTMLPLHGIDVIYKTAKSLQNNSKIHFTIIGDTQLKQIEPWLELLQQLPNVTYIKWVRYDELISYIKYADVCLGGPSGNTGQAKRVVTGKTLQFLTIKKKVIISNNIENKHRFKTNKLTCITNSDSNHIKQLLLNILQSTYD